MRLFDRIKNSALLAKVSLGVGALGIVGMIGFGAAQAATGSTAGTGYGNSTQAVAAADTFQNSLNSNTSNFILQVKTLEVNAYNQLNNGTPVVNFDAQYNTATLAYLNTTSDAFDTFRAKVVASANTAQSKDQFIDQFNHAKADYLNQLDAAKNTLATNLSNLGDRSNQVKDQFMNGYNSDRDAYSNNLEAAKNAFAATVSNL